MGTDIYAILEVQDDEGAWHVAPPWSGRESIDIDLARSYPLFGLLAGVRGDDEPLIVRRGLPTDLSAEGRKFFYVDDEDGPWLGCLSWWTLQEILDAPWPDDTRWWRDDAKDWRAFGPPERTRLVFGFD